MSYYGCSYGYGGQVQAQPPSYYGGSNGYGGQVQAQSPSYYGGSNGYGATQAQSQGYYSKPHGYGHQAQTSTPFGSSNDGPNYSTQAQSQGYYSKPYGYGPPTQTSSPYGSSNRPDFAAQAQSQGYYSKPHGYGPSAQTNTLIGSSNNGPDLVQSMIGPCETFPPGTDPKIIECYNRMDRDGNGFIDDRELQSVLSSIRQQFSMRTVRLLMCSFTNNTNQRTIGPKEFIPLIKCLQQWKTTFQRYDRDRNGRIDASELRQVFQSSGYPVSPVILNLLISKFDKSGSMCSLGYDNFIECCMIVKGLTDRFKAKEDLSGSATFTHEEFMINTLPFIIA